MEEKKIIQPFDIIAYFYPEDTPLRQLLIKHSSQVRDKALEILSNPRNAALPVNRELVIAGALLHDIGIGQCNAPDILCIGTKPYIAHGLAGAEMLRQYGKIQHIDMEIYARFCERHTSSGLTRENILKEKLPLPARDFLPETLEEKLVCLADKFYSKSGKMHEKTLEKARRSMAKFGDDVLKRFDDLCQLFHVS